LKIKGKPSVTALFDIVMRGGRQAEQANTLLEKALEADSQQRAPRRRAMSEAALGQVQLSDQQQLGLAVEAICASLKNEPYILQWLEGYFAKNCKLFKPKPSSPIEVRIEAVRDVFKRQGSERWDGVLIEQVKNQIAISSTSIAFDDVNYRLCDVDKCQRLTAAEALTLALSSRDLTPNFSSHTLGAHYNLLELICYTMRTQPGKAKAVEKVALGVALHLAQRLIFESACTLAQVFTQFHLPILGQAEAETLAKAGFYPDSFLISGLPKALPNLQRLKEAQALSLDFTQEPISLPSSPAGSSHHQRFAQHLSQASPSIIALNGHEGHLSHYGPLFKNAENLWLIMSEISEAGLKSLEDLPQCRVLCIQCDTPNILDYKRLKKIIDGAPLLEMLAIDGVIFALSSFRKKDHWSRKLRGLKIEVSLQGRAESGAMHLALSLLPINHVHLVVHYPSKIPELIPMPPDIESGTKTAAARGQRFDQMVELHDAECEAAKIGEMKTLATLLGQLGHRDHLTIETHTWPQELDALLPSLAKNLKLKCKDFMPSKAPRILWNQESLSWEGPTPRTSGEWLGTRDRFELNLGEVTFANCKFSQAQLESLISELASAGEIVRSLNLPDNDLTFEALPLLLKLIQETRLLRLNLSNNPLTESKGAERQKPAEASPPPLPAPRTMVRPLIYADPDATYGQGAYSGEAASGQRPEGLYDEDIAAILKRDKEAAGASAAAQGLYELDPEEVSGIPREASYIALGEAGGASAAAQGLYELDPEEVSGTPREASYIALGEAGGASAAAQGLYELDPEEVNGFASSEEGEPTYEVRSSEGPVEQPLYAEMAGSNKVVHAPKGMYGGRVMKIVNSLNHRAEEAPEASHEEESAPQPPPRDPTRKPLASAYLSSADVALGDFIEKVAEFQHLISLDLSGCGWSEAILEALPKLKHTLELGIGTERCEDADVDAILAALEKTNVRFVKIPVTGELQNKVARWNLERAKSDPSLHQSEV